MVEARQCRLSRVPFPKMAVWVCGQDSRGVAEKHAWKMAQNYFLKRFSKAWRASSGRDGAASAAAAVCAGCE